MCLLNLIKFFVDIMLALGAILAAFFAGATWRQAKKFNEAEKRSKRAFLVPLQDKSYYNQSPDTVSFSEEKWLFYMPVKNLGINPAEDIDCVITTYQLEENQSVQDEVTFRRLFNFSDESINLIPHEHTWNLVLGEKPEYYGINEIDWIRTDYIIVELVMSSNVRNFVIVDS